MHVDGEPLVSGMFDVPKPGKEGAPREERFISALVPLMVSKTASQRGGAASPWLREVLFPGAMVAGREPTPKNKLIWSQDLSPNGHNGGNHDYIIMIIIAS